MQIFPNSTCRGSSIPDELYRRVIESCFQSSEMRTYLLEARKEYEFMLNSDKITEIVQGAPIPLTKKQALFKALYEFRPFVFSEAYREINLAVNALNTNQGDVFYARIKRFWEMISDEDVYDIAPFLDIKTGLEGIKTAAEFEELRSGTYWGEFEKWVPRNNRLENPYTFYFMGGKPVWFEKKIYNEDGGFWLPDRDGFVRGDSLNLPIPFGVGDIVTLNCAPFAPVKHALLIYVDNVDCCGVRMIHRDTDGLWYDSALKHAHGWGHYTPMLSPLYRLSSYKGDLPKEERFLLKVRDIIGNDAEKGWEFSKMILKSEICGMTAEEIMKLMMQL